MLEKRVHEGCVCLCAATAVAVTFTAPAAAYELSTSIPLKSILSSTPRPQAQYQCPLQLVDVLVIRKTSPQAVFHTGKLPFELSRPSMHAFVVALRADQQMQVKRNMRRQLQASHLSCAHNHVAGETHLKQHETSCATYSAKACVGAATRAAAVAIQWQPSGGGGGVHADAQSLAASGPNMTLASQQSDAN
jgi:hypothetical protein